MSDEFDLAITAVGKAVPLRCFSLYLLGKTIEEIAEETGISSRIIKGWEKTENWIEEKEKLGQEYRELVRQQTAIDTAEMKERHASTARQIQDFVQSELDRQVAENKIKPFRGWNEMTQVLERTVAIEREAMAGSVDQEFVARIIEIIKNNVDDPETRRKLADALKNLIATQKK